MNILEQKKAQLEKERADQRASRQADFDLQELLRTKAGNDEDANDGDAIPQERVDSWSRSIRDLGRSLVATPLPAPHIRANPTPTLKSLYSNARSFLAQRGQTAKKIYTRGATPLPTPKILPVKTAIPGFVFSGLDQLQKGAARVIRGVSAVRLRALANQLPHNLNPNTKSAPAPDDPSFDAS